MASITQIPVRGRLVGLVGLMEAIHQVGELSLPPELIPDFLLRRVMEQNYVATSAEEDYRNAVFRFYCRHVGLPVDEETSEGLVIRVLGPGCANCNRLEQEVTSVLMEMDVPADLQHVTDIKEIASYGVMATPALVVNGQVVSLGSVPPRARIKALLQEVVERPGGLSQTNL